MNTEKITIERFIDETFSICDVSGVGQVKNMMPEMKRIINVFLKQIRDEMYNKATPFEDSSGYIYSKTLFMSEVDEVFNKYLNEKGGK